MAHVHLLRTILLTCIIAFTFHTTSAQEGYMPHHCAKSDYAPAYFNCPVPYVEMVSDGTKTFVEQVLMITHIEPSHVHRNGARQ